MMKEKLKKIRKDRKDEKRFSGDIEKPKSKRSEESEVLLLRNAEVQCEAIEER